MAYNDTPQPTQRLSTSQPLIRQNFTQLDASFAVDHYTYSDLTANNGRHKDIHQVARIGNAPNLAGASTIFSKSYTPDTTGGVADIQLFNISALGGVSQLTGNLSLTDGWCWVGGVLIQWGVVTLPGSGTVTFKDRVVGAIPFPTSCFNVNATLKPATPPTSNSQTISVYNILPGSFQYNYSGGSAYNAFYWFAVGN